MNTSIRVFYFSRVTLWSFYLDPFLYCTTLVNVKLSFPVTRPTALLRHTRNVVMTNWNSTELRDKRRNILPYYHRRRVTDIPNLLHFVLRIVHGMRPIYVFLPNKRKTIVSYKQVIGDTLSVTFFSVVYFSIITYIPPLMLSIPNRIDSFRR